MNDDEELAFQGEDDPLAEAADADNLSSGEVGRSGLDRAKDKRIGQPHLRKWLTHKALLQRLDVDGHIGKFRHGIVIMKLSCEQRMRSSAAWSSARWRC